MQDSGPQGPEPCSTGCAPYPSFKIRAFEILLLKRLRTMSFKSTDQKIEGFERLDSRGTAGPWSSMWDH